MPRADVRPAGNTLLELMLVVTVIGILVGWTSPRFGVAVEHTRVDQAAAALRSLWLAERLHWLEHRTFTDDLGELADQRFLDQALLTQAQPFAFSIESADAESFLASAERAGSAEWVGIVSIDEAGVLSGSTHDGGGHVVAPSP